MILFNGMLLFIQRPFFSKQRDLVVIMCYNHVYLQQKKKSASNHEQN